MMQHTASVTITGPFVPTPAAALQRGDMVLVFGELERVLSVQTTPYPHRTTVQTKHGGWHYAPSCTLPKLQGVS